MARTTNTHYFTAVSFVLCSFFVSSVYSGECCKAFTGITGEEHPAKWCSEYCCHDVKTLLLEYDCCDNEYLRADESMRDSFCVQWWAEHFYVPVLIGVGVLLFGILTCCCCCCGCCRRQRPGFIVQGQASGPVVMVQQQQQQSTGMSFDSGLHAGYDQ